MTRGIIEAYRFLVIPYVVNKLKKFNYEGKGVSGAKEFMSDFNEIFDLAIKALEQEPKSEWQKDHEILKAYSDGANEVLDKIRAEIDELYSYVEIDEDLKASFNMVRLEEVQRVIDKYKAESEDNNAEVN